MELALHRDEEKVHNFRGSQAAKSGIDVYSCSGKLIRRINVCVNGRSLSLGHYC